MLGVDFTLVYSVVTGSQSHFYKFIVIPVTTSTWSHLGDAVPILVA